MYLVKICKEKQILDVLHYQKFENVFADVADKSIFRDAYIPKEILSEIDKCQMPKIFSGSETSKGADDFEFRYENGIYVYAGTIFLKDENRCEE